MRIARTAATFGLVLAVSACGTSLTEPRGDHGRTPEPDRKEMVSPDLAEPRKGGNLIGSGS